MKCSHCQTDSVEGAAFCMKCGTRSKRQEPANVPGANARFRQRLSFALLQWRSKNNCPFASDSEALRLNFEASGFRTKPLDAYELSLLPPLDIPFILMSALCCTA